MEFLTSPINQQIIIFYRIKQKHQKYLQDAKKLKYKLFENIEMLHLNKFQTIFLQVNFTKIKYFQLGEYDNPLFYS